MPASPAYRVCVATQSWKLSGVNVFCANLVRGLRERGVGAEIVLTEQDTDLVRVPDPVLPLPEDIPVACLPVGVQDGWGAHWGAMIRYLEERAPCIYIPNSDWRHSGVAPLLSDRVGVVGVVHSDDPLHYEHVSRMGRYWNAIVTVSKALAEKTVAIDPCFAPRIVTIPIGVNVAAALPARSSDPGRPLEIVYHGLLVQRQKRILDLPLVMDALVRRGIPARLTVVGAGAQETQLREASRHHMEAGRMRLLGVLPNEKILGLLEQEDAFIMTSEFEGMPNALLEAMGRGCVPVVTDIRSGIPEVVRDGDSGYLLPVGDIDGFAERFARLQRDPEHRRAMSSRAYRTVEEGSYRTRDMARDYEALFERVLSEAGRRTYVRPRGPLSLPPRQVAGVSILPMPFPYTIEGVGAFPSQAEAQAFLGALPEGKARELLSGRRISRGGWILADGQGPAVCVATSTPNALSESTFIRAHMQRLPARVTVLAGLEPPPLSEDDLPVAASKRDRILRAAGRRLLRRDFAKAPDAAIARHLRRERVTAVLAEYGPTGARLLSACRLARVPLIVHFHGYDASVRKVVEGHGGYAKLFAGAAAVIAVSRDMEARLLALGAPRDRLHYIPYGVDTALFAAADPAHSPPVFVAVGRFVEKKAPELTLLAFRKAREEVAEARLVMIGDGPLLGPCQRMARALGLDEAVAFRGAEPPSSVAAALAAARAFVQHSVTALDGDAEGTPLSVIEASAAGLPVVATRHAGIKDVVLEEETGFLVAEGDVEAMAGHLVRLTHEPSLAARMGKAGRERMLDLFSIEKSISQLWHVIRSVSPGPP